MNSNWNITLRQLFQRCVAPSKTLASSSFSRELLPVELYDTLFHNVKNSTRSKIINGTDPCFRQHHLHTALFLSDSEQSFQNCQSHINEQWFLWLTKKYAALTEADLHFFLKDSELTTSLSEEWVQKLIPWFKSYGMHFSSEETASLLTVLTLLSITHGSWDLIYEKLLPSWLLKTTESTDSSTNSIYQKAQLAFSNGFLNEALQLLAYVPQTGAVHYLTSQIFRTQRNTMDQTVNSEAWKNCTLAIQDHLLSACSCHYLPAMLELAQEYYTATTNSVFSQNTANCDTLCHLIVSTAPNSPEAGEAYWMLYQLAIRNEIIPPTDESAEFYLKSSYDCGNVYASKEYINQNSISLIHTYQRAVATDSGEYYCNECNEFADIIHKTAPQSWRAAENWADFSKSSPINIFLISNETSRNISDFLQIVQSVKDQSVPLASVPCIFIRGEEEKLAPILDTALVRLDPIILPVRILDDARLSTRILSSHPLFFPIRKLAGSIDASGVLHYCIIGSTKTCEWLIREAFWMLTFRSSNIQVRITVLAPDAAAVYHRIRFLCPGMDPAVLSELKKHAAHIDYIDCAYESDDFLNHLRFILSDKNVYFSVDTGTDIDNMILATKIREESIRYMVNYPTKLSIDNLPVITFKCTNADIANLSLSTVVINEASGHAWNNNYAIIPFGILEEQYHWNALVHDTIEELAYCVHLQYCDIDSSDWFANQTALHDAKASYYNRTYNRDSSLAVAAGLPYRLFQFHYPDTAALVPPHWNIYDKDAYFSTRNLTYYANCLNGKTTEDDSEQYDYNGGSFQRNGPCIEETLALAEWEHNRWNMFMISRGWLSAGVEQVIDYYRKGNTRQQLYIGKLNPCICKYSALSKLEHAFKKELGIVKHIKELDIKSIQMTEAILRMEWIEREN